MSGWREDKARLEAQLAGRQGLVDELRQQLAASRQGQAHGDGGPGGAAGSGAIAGAGTGGALFGGAPVVTGWAAYRSAGGPGPAAGATSPQTPPPPLAGVQGGGGTGRAVSPSPAVRSVAWTTTSHVPPGQQYAAATLREQLTRGYSAAVAAGPAAASPSFSPAALAEDVAALAAQQAGLRTTLGNLEERRQRDQQQYNAARQRGGYATGASLQDRLSPQQPTSAAAYGMGLGPSSAVGSLRLLPQRAGSAGVGSAGAWEASSVGRAVTGRVGPAVAGGAGGTTGLGLEASRLSPSRLLALGAQKGGVGVGLGGGGSGDTGGVGQPGSRGGGGGSLDGAGSRWSRGAGY